MTIRNRELSQFGSFISIDDESQNISITDSETPYVGIGTTNPQEKLQVAGNVKIDGNLTVEGTFDFDFDNFTLEGDANINITGIVTASSFVSDEGVLAVTDRWDRTGDDIYKLIGNVGIGLSNPSQRLSVNGNISAGQFISTVTATAPFQVNSSTEVANLNASLLRGGVPGQNINSNDIVTLGASQTLTNKTLTSPIVNSTGIVFNGTTGTTTLRANATAAGTLTLPVTTGTLVSTGDTGVVTSNMIANLNIIDIDVSDSAAIAYSKLNLSNSIVNADIVTGTIANNKLTNSSISGVALGSNLFTLTRGTYLTGSNYNGSAATTWAVDATSANTADKVVARDGSGNFSANTITLANNLTASSGTITGQTLSVGSGGISVSGNLNISGVSTFAGITTVTGTTLFTKQLNVSGVSTFAGITTVTGTTLFTTQLSTSGITSITNTSNSTSTTTGALRVAGGVGIGSSLYVGGTVTATTFNGTISIPTIHVQDQKASGTNGGTFTSGAWQTRTLNTSVTNGISGASLAANAITLPAGTYEVEASANAFRVNLHQIRFSGTGVTIYGMSAFATFGTTGGTDVPMQSTSTLRGTFTIASTTSFNLEHQCETTKTTDGFGLDCGFGNINIYADVRIRKIS